MKTFLIKIPPDNKKKEKTFHELLELLHESLGENSVSFEIFAHTQHISFGFSGEDTLGDLLRGQIYSFYPEAEIIEIPDFLTQATHEENPNFFAMDIALQKNNLLPLKIYEEFEGDSLSALLSTLAKTTIDESVFIEYIIKPQRDTGFFHFLRGIRTWLESIRHIFRIKFWFKKGNTRKTIVAAMQKKNEQRLFHTTVRLSVFAKTPERMRNRIESVFQAYAQFNTLDLNRFKKGSIKRSPAFFNIMKQRRLGRTNLFSLSELATLFHLPNEREVPNIIYVLSKKSESPSSLPIDRNNHEISFIGETNFHNSLIPFGMMRTDRRRHLYVVGKSGSGKSKLLELLIKNDLENGKGIGVLDPHGDLVDNVLKMVPKDRIKDVVLFDPSDMNFPIAFNPLEKVPPELKMRVTIGFIEIFKKLFGINWNAKLEHVLRYTILALLDSPNTTVLSIMKMLTDKNYRQYIIRGIEEDFVKNFWVNEFAAWSEKFDAEAITPLLNKMGQFVATNMIRNIVGQPENKLHFRDIMDNGKILLMKVSKGILGEENAGLLGAMAITKIYQSAMSRADTPEEERTDFYFYVDEFHNFATDTFDEILSEARKYRLNITIAHQFMGQLSSKIRTTVFGNVGSLMSFRVGAEDAGILASEFNPIFTPRDIINLGIREFYCKMSINGEITQAFSARTLDMKTQKEHFAKEAQEYSRKMYCTPKEEAEKMISSWNESATNEDQKAQGGNKNFEEVEFEEPII
ncbi:type IV secretory system conjugative DNA transfer family protein [Candidatus Peregrinibacteria bacterium]|nr:type IV secretory system conjugative DNA transfer family protein [Candidatus Peregrinibacteria bacterium]